MKLISFTFLVVHVVNKNLFVDGQTDCGRISLTYVQAGSTVEAKLRFSPSTELSRYKWVHFFSRTKPNFDFLKDVEEDRLKYNLKDFELIIKDLQASDDGIYNTECYLENGYQTFSENRVEIKKPYTVQPSTNLSSVTSKVVTESTLKQTSKTTAYVISVTTQAVQENPKKTLATHEHSTHTTNKDDKYATYEVPYSKSDPDQVTVVSNDTGITSDDTITTILVIVVCGVVVIFGIITTLTVTIALRKKTCRPKTTEEEGDQQQNSSHYTAVLDKTEDDANYCEINQLEDGRVASDTKLQTFSSPEPDVTPVSNTTHVGNIYPNTRADESEHEYTVIKCDSETTIGHDSATGYCRKKTDDYVNCKTLTTTSESGNEYEIIKY